MVRNQGLSKNQRTDAPKLTAGNSRAPATSRGRGGRGGGKAVAPAPARRQILVNRPRQDRHDDDEVDSDKENENEELEDLDVRQEEEEEEEDKMEEGFEWKCRLLEVIQQYPEVFDLADPRYKDRNQRDSAWEEIATAMDATGQ